MTTLTLAVMSDLHIAGDDRNRPGGWLNASSNRTDDGHDLLGELRRILVKERLTADYLISPGDLTDKANSAGLIRAWSIVDSVRRTLDAKSSIGATGNHDTDSRGVATPGDPFKTLRELDPPFPFGSDVFAAANTHYWGHGYASVDLHGGARLVNINSCRSHIDEEHAKRGYLDGALINDVIDSLTQVGQRDMNILVTHHHPMKLGTVNTRDDSHMVGGEVLLERLLRSGTGPWFVLHGHKHIPRVEYFGAGGVSLPLFAAGSFAARLWDEAASIAQNQFYLIELGNGDPALALDAIVGTFRAWSWIPGSGWRESGISGGITSGSGFGCRTQIVDLANRVHSVTAQSVKPWLERQELIALVPQYAHLTPLDQETLHGELKARGAFLSIEDGLLEQIAVP